MTIEVSRWLKIKQAWSKWVHATPPVVPPGYPSQAEIEAETSGYTPGGWDVTANHPRTEQASPNSKSDGAEEG